MQEIFSNAELVIKLQTSPMTQMSMAINPAIKIPRKPAGTGTLSRGPKRRGKPIFITRVI